MMMQQIQKRESDTDVLNAESDGDLNGRSQSLHGIGRSRTRVSDNSRDADHGNYIPPATARQFLSPVGTRKTVSPFSSPSNETDEGTLVSPLTTSTKSLLNGPITVPTPWAKDEDMGRVRKEKPKSSNNDPKEAEDSFEMNLKASYDRLSSIRYANGSYTRDLDLHKTRWSTNPDYVPNQPTRVQSSMNLRSSSRSSLGTQSVMSKSLSNISKRFGENSFGHEGNKVKDNASGTKNADWMPMQPIRLRSIQGMVLHSSSRSFNSIHDGLAVSGRSSRSLSPPRTRDTTLRFRTRQTVGPSYKKETLFSSALLNLALKPPKLLGTLTGGRKGKKKKTKDEQNCSLHSGSGPADKPKSRLLSFGKGGSKYASSEKEGIQRSSRSNRPSIGGPEVVSVLSSPGSLSNIKKVFKDSMARSSATSSNKMMT